MFVRLKPSVSPLMARRVFAGARDVHRYAHPSNLYWVLPRTGQEEEFVATLNKEPGVAYTSPNYIVRAQTPVPTDDTNFGEQWALQSTGNGMDAPSLWGSFGTGSDDVVIAVIDSGVDCKHRDLEKNLWRNPDETPGDGVDNDNNGYVDDIIGINAIDPKQSPCGEYAHGTWVAGVIAAVGNNNDAQINNGTKWQSITGVLWTANILPCKFMQSDSGELMRAIECLDYVAKLKTKHPTLRIVATNNSWGDIPFNQALEDAIVAQRELGILFVTAAGNCPGSVECNLDVAPRYPASSMQPNVITVAAIRENGTLTATSKYGRRTVHVAAPGESILTTAPNDLFQLVPDSTSIATPHVTGLIGLLAQGPAAPPDWRYLRNFVLTSGVTQGALTSSTMSGRRIGGAGMAGKACNDPLLRARMFPKGSSLTVSVGSSVPLIAMQLDCALPSGPVPVSIEKPDGTISNLDLKDDGNVVLDDGIYEDNWTPMDTGDHKVTFFAGSGAGVADKFTITVP